MSDIASGSRIAKHADRQPGSSLIKPLSRDHSIKLSYATVGRAAMVAAALALPFAT